MAVDLEQVKQDLTKMKNAGCNFIRLCHYPHHPGELDLCDELGLFVLAENTMNEWGLRGLSAPYVAGGALWCYARHPWPWNNVSSYGYVSRDRMSRFPAFSVVERLYREYSGKNIK